MVPNWVAVPEPPKKVTTAKILVLALSTGLNNERASSSYPAKAFNLLDQPSEFAFGITIPIG
jgi:hypothetical protein